MPHVALIAGGVLFAPATTPFFVFTFCTTKALRIVVDVVAFVNQKPTWLLTVPTVQAVNG
jgi:hypothetical protein